MDLFSWIKRRPRILSISYDESLLSTRQMILEDAGFEVVSVLGFVAALEQCAQGRFDLVIVGHSIPPADQQTLLEAVRNNCDAPVLSLRKPTETALLGADYSIDSFEPQNALAAVRQMLTPARQ